MKKGHALVTLLILIWLGTLSIWVGTRSPQLIPSASTSNALDRVLKSGKIRAGWAVFEPLCMRDANTGKLSGIGVDILEEAARRLNLQVEWAEETGWGVLFESLNADRFDIFGVGVWRNGSRGRVGIFSDPLFFNAIKVWARPGETRFKSLTDLNSPGVRISTQDGGMDDLIAKSVFPAATVVSVPEISNYSDVLLNLVSGKADATFAEPAAVGAFLRENHGTLVELFPDTPVRVFPVCYAFKMGAFDLQSTINSALVEMQNDATIDTIISKYEIEKGNFYRVSPGYRTPARNTQ